MSTIHTFVFVCLTVIWFIFTINTFVYVYITDGLPFSIRILVESAVRHCDQFQVLNKDVENILDWKENQNLSIEIPFKPARVILQDFT